MEGEIVVTKRATYRTEENLVGLEAEKRKLGYINLFNERRNKKNNRIKNYYNCFND